MWADSIEVIDLKLYSINCELRNLHLFSLSVTKFLQGLGRCDFYIWTPFMLTLLVNDGTIRSSLKDERVFCVRTEPWRKRRQHFCFKE